jgi:hypothetical protein
MASLLREAVKWKGGGKPVLVIRLRLHTQTKRFLAANRKTSVLGGINVGSTTVNGLQKLESPEQFDDGRTSTVLTMHPDFGICFSCGIR